jgi:predicted ATPase
MKFQHLLLPPGETLDDKVLEKFSRAWLKKKAPNNFFVLNVSKGGRIVFSSVVHPLHGEVLVYRAEFKASAHGHYEQYLSTVIPIKNIETYHLVKLSSGVAAGAGAGAFLAKAQGLEEPLALTSYVEYRGQIFTATDEQEGVAEPLFNNHKSAIVSGGAGAGKTLLAENVLRLAASEGYADIVYLSANKRLSKQMSESMAKQGIKVVCIDLEGMQRINELDRFYAFRSREADSSKLGEKIEIDYKNICLLAALQAAGVADGKLFSELASYQLMLQAYSNYLIHEVPSQDYNLGIRFPLGLLRCADIVVIDEYQQFPLPLLNEIAKLKKFTILFGDPNQAITPASQVGLAYINNIFQPCDEHFLEQTHRVPVGAGALANEMLRIKTRVYNQKRYSELKVDETKIGQLYSCCKEILGKQQTLALSLDTAVVYLDEEDRAWCEQTFGSGLVYCASEILGSEFDKIIIVSPEKATPNQPAKVEKSEANMDYMTELSMLSALYVALTRAQSSVLLIFKHPKSYSSFPVDNAKKLINSSEVETHFGGRPPSMLTVITYIDNELGNEKYTRAKKLFYQYNIGNDFLYYCSIKGFKLPPQYSSEAESAECRLLVLKSRLLCRHLRAEELDWIRCNSDLLLMDRLSDDFINAAIRLIATTDYTQHLICTRIETFLIEVLRSGKVMMQLQAAVALTACLLEKKGKLEARSSARVTEICNVLVELICGDADNKTKAAVAMTLGACLESAKKKQMTFDFLSEVYAPLLQLIADEADGELNGKVALEVSIFLYRIKINPDDEQKLQVVFKPLAQLIVGASTIYMQAKAALGLSQCITLTTARPMEADLEIFSQVCSSLCHSLSTETAFPQRLLRGLTTCLHYIQIKPAKILVTSAFYEILLKLATSEPNYSLQLLICLALEGCLKKAKAKEDDILMLSQFYVALPKFIESKEKIKSEIGVQMCNTLELHITLALINCMRFTLARPAGNMRSVVFKLFLKRVVSVDCVFRRTVAANQLSRVLMPPPKELIPVDITEFPTLYDLLLDLIVKASDINEKGRAIHNLQICLRHTTASPVKPENIKDIYAVSVTYLEQLEQNGIEKIAIYTCVEMINFIIGRHAESLSTAENCKKIHAAIDAMSKIKLDMSDSFYKLLKRTSRLMQQKNSYQWLVASITGEADDELKIDAATELNNCLLHSGGAKPAEMKMLSKVYAPLLDLITGDADNKLKGRVAIEVGHFLKYIDINPVDASKVRVGFKPLIQLISENVNEKLTIRAASGLVVCLGCKMVQPKPADLKEVSQIYKLLFEQMVDAGASDWKKENLLRVLTEWLTDTTVRPDNLSVISAFYTPMLALIKVAAQDGLKIELCEALVACLRFTFARPAEYSVIDKFYSSLPTLIEGEVGSERRHILEMGVGLGLICFIHFTKVIPKKSTNVIVCKILLNVMADVKEVDTKWYALDVLMECIAHAGEAGINLNSAEVSKFYDSMVDWIAGEANKNIKSGVLYSIGRGLEMTSLRLDNPETAQAIYSMSLKYLQKIEADKIDYVHNSRDLDTCLSNIKSIFSNHLASLSTEENIREMLGAIRALKDKDMIVKELKEDYLLMVNSKLERRIQTEEGPVLPFKNGRELEFKEG